MLRVFRLVSYCLIGLNGLLLFLWFFQKEISIPGWLQMIGRMHPMILHLPIGFFVMAVVIIALQKQFKRKVFKSSLQLIFVLTALSLTVTALAGIILSKEGGYDTDTLQGHLNSGVVLSVLTAILATTTFKKRLTTTQYSLTGMGFLILLITGHFGATLTHGEGYLFGPPAGDKLTKTINNDSITLFAKAILPVLDKKCVSCHNPKKKKGELILTTPEDILKGGEDGQVINMESPKESEFLKRVHLPVEHDDHMPPFGKPQLTKSETGLLNKWITAGANFNALWKSYPDADSLVLLAKQVLAGYEKPKAKTYDFDFASRQEIEALNSPFRTVSQISTEAPALKASYYLAQYFSADNLNQLESVEAQLVELNLAGMPISDSDIKHITQFGNLESLNLNNTSITDEGAKKLKSLTKLQKLSLSGTKISISSLTELADLPNLKEVFLWNTSVTSEDLVKLNSDHTTINWEFGYQPNKKEVLKLTPPILKNESFLLKEGESIALKHNLPGTTIRISWDGSDPDSVDSKIYTGPISLNDHATLKTMATKEGWLKSNVLEYSFFVAGVKPSQVELLSVTNKDYKAKGAISLTDNLIGDAGNFRDGNWLGFRETKFIGQFSWDENSDAKKVTLIYNRNIGSYLMPPESVEIWAGKDAASLNLLAKVKPEQPSRYMPTKIESISYPLDKPYKVIRVIGTPVSKLPSWHSGKGEKGWLMVSEVIFK